MLIGASLAMDNPHEVYSRLGGFASEFNAASSYQTPYMTTAPFAVPTARR